MERASVSVLVSAKDGIVALGKFHTRSAPCLRSLPRLPSKQCLVEHRSFLTLEDGMSASTSASKNSWRTRRKPFIEWQNDISSTSKLHSFKHLQRQAQTALCRMQDEWWRRRPTKSKPTLPQITKNVLQCHQGSLRPLGRSWLGSSSIASSPASRRKTCRKPSVDSVQTAAPPT